MAEAGRRWSPYNFSYNNPIRFIDPDGMLPIMMNEEQGGFQQLTGFERYGQNWSSHRAWEKSIKEDISAAQILLEQIKSFLSYGGSTIEEISDQNGKKWGIFSFNFHNGSLNGTFAINSNVNTFYKFENITGIGGVVDNNEAIGQRVIHDFEKRLYSKGPLTGKQLVWTLTGTLEFTQIQDNKGVWHLEQGSDEIYTDIKRNGWGPWNLLVDPSKYEYLPYHYFKEYNSPIHNYNNLYKQGGISLYGTIIFQRTLGAKNISLPVYDMWVFSISAIFEIPYVQFVSDINVEFNFQEKKYGVPGFGSW